MTTPLHTPLPVIKLLSTVYEICPDTMIGMLVIKCPVCKMEFLLTVDGELERYATHFKAYWETHRPDFITATGEAVQIVRRL